MAVLARFTPSDPDSRYGYIPTEWICILFIALFSVSTVLHAYQAIRCRLWWLLPTACLAGLGEIIGWSGRLWSSFNPGSLNPYLMQITTTIIAPTPLIAALFIVLGRIIGQLGPCYSRLSPKWYSIIFCSCDLIALIVQSVGGASASSAASNGTSPTKGGHIMLGGIIFQMAAITVYAILASEFLVRYLKDMPLHPRQEPRLPHMPPNTKLMVVGLYVCTFFIYIRSIYRTVELIDGWTGEIIQTEWIFNVFDGAMIVLAMYTLNCFHPGRLLLVPQAGGGMSQTRSRKEPFVVEGGVVMQEMRADSDDSQCTFRSEADLKAGGSSAFSPV